MKTHLLLLLLLCTTIFAEQQISIINSSISVDTVSYPTLNSDSVKLIPYKNQVHDVSKPGNYLLESNLTYSSGKDDIEPALFLGPSPFPIIITLNGKVLYRFGNLKESSTIANFSAITVPLTSLNQGKNSLKMYLYSDGQVISCPPFSVGSYPEIAKKSAQQTLLNSKLIQSIAFVALFAFIFFLSYSASSRFTDRDILYFSFFTLTIFWGYFHFVMNSPLNNGLLWFKASRVAYVFAPLFLFLFTTEYTKQLRKPWVKTLLTIVAIPYALLIIESNSIGTLNMRFSIISLLHVLPLLFFNFILLIRSSIVSKKKAVSVILIGYITFSTTVFIDIGHLLIQREPYFWSTPYGYFILMSTIIFVVTIRHSFLYRDLISYKSELIYTNQSLVDAHNKAVQESRAKESFIKAIAHEFRTPLNGMAGVVTSLVNEKHISESVRKRTKILNSSFYQFELIVQNILDYQNIKNEQLTLNIHPFDPFLMITQTISSCFDDASGKGISLITLANKDSIPSILLGDSPRVGLVLHNLIQNAIKFTNTGGVSIKAEYINQKLRLEVSDTGCGINADKQSKIFDSFERGEERSFSQRYEGIGLGLAIVDAIIRSMNGTISFKSIVDKGTHFTVDIPLEESDTIGTETDEPLHILVVDDNRVNRTVAVLQLEKFSYITSIASNGKEAVDMVREQKFDLILMDVQMPIMDGLEATKIIKREFPTIPVVGVTANGSREECMEVGMSDVLYKPTSSEALNEIIQSITE